MAEQISYLQELIHSISEFIHSSSRSDETVKKLVGHLDVMNAFVIEYSKIDTDNNHHLQQLAGDVRYMVCRAEAAAEKLIIFRTSQQRSNLVSKGRHLLLSFNLLNLEKQMQDVSAKVGIILQERALPGLEALKIGVAANKGEKALVVEEDNGVGFEDEAKTVIELLTGKSEQLEMLQKIKPREPIFKAFYVRP